MPLTSKGSKIKSAMTKKYGRGRGEQVFYASANKGTISNVEKKKKLSAGGTVRKTGNKAKFKKTGQSRVNAFSSHAKSVLGV